MTNNFVFVSIFFAKWNCFCFFFIILICEKENIYHFQFAASGDDGRAHVEWSVKNLRFYSFRYTVGNNLDFVNQIHIRIVWKETDPFPHV